MWLPVPQAACCAALDSICAPPGPAPQSDVPAALDDTTQVDERIFFAGDWVDGPVDIGYTHGAVAKGRAAADLLLASLQ